MYVLVLSREQTQYTHQLRTRQLLLRFQEEYDGEDLLGVPTSNSKTIDLGDRGELWQG